METNTVEQIAYWAQQSAEIEHAGFLVVCVFLGWLVGVALFSFRHR